jgi:putative ABC transport system permease protein
VLLFTIGLSLGTGVLCGLIPALQASTFAITADLGEESGRVSEGRKSGRTRDVLVAAEIAVALMLLVGAGLLLRSFHSLSRVDTGIQTHNLLTFETFLSGERAKDKARQAAFYRDALDAIAALPGVRRAAAAVTLPIGGDNFATAFILEGQAAPPPGQEARAGFQVVTPGYFDTMGIRVLNGRDFTAADDDRAPGVVMVNETFVRQRFPGANPIGRRLRLGGDGVPWLTVVGVVSDIRHLGPATPARPELYRPYTQDSFPFMSFVVRTERDPAALVPAIRAAISRLDPGQAISRVNTMEEHLATALSRPKFMSRLVAVFGLLALLLSTVGVYGVMAYSVTQRTREIAIRAALGANRSDVMRLVLTKALWLAALGMLAGIAGATALSSVLSGLLFGILATDAATYAAVIVLLGSVAMLAAAVPALRAARIPGAQVLRG